MMLVACLLGVMLYLRRNLMDDQAGFSEPIFPELLGWMSCFLPWAFLAPIVFRLERRYPLVRGGWVRNLVILFAFGVVLSSVAYFAAMFLSAAAHSAFARAIVMPRRSLENVLGEIFVQQFGFWASVGTACAIRNLMQMQQQERDKAALLLEKSRLEASLREAELDALRARLNPHFLFNTLQNISVLAQQEPKTASQMLTRLGDLLRTALRSESQSETSLQSEIKLTESYVAVEKMRFGDRLSVVFDLAPGTSEAMVPTLLLQPLVENAIEHGLKEIAGTGEISIRSGIEEHRLVLTVKDNGQGVPGQSLQELKLGIGLGATRDRLARMYGANGELTVRRLAEGGTVAQIILPLRSAPHEAVIDEQASRTYRG
jgi:LytS/YehU family sensor histidine kinase